MSLSAETLPRPFAGGGDDGAGTGGPVVDVRGVQRVFGDNAVLEGIDLQLRAGDFVALLGPSGTGKTTLLRILAGLDTADAGQVLVPHARSVVFQEPRLVPSRRVWRNVVLGDHHPRRLQSEALAALDEVGLGDKGDAWPLTLSGGEAQRVALARALVTEPSLLLLDEPFAALDALTRIRMHDLVSELVRRHRPATLLVTHDVDEAILLSDRILVLAHGSIDLDVTVDLDTPRQRTEPRFVALKERLLDQLGVGRPTPR